MDFLVEQLLDDFDFLLDELDEDVDEELDEEDPLWDGNLTSMSIPKSAGFEILDDFDFLCSVELDELEESVLGFSMLTMTS